MVQILTFLFCYYLFTQYELAEFCISSLPQNPLLPIYKSIICGQKLSNQQHIILFSQLGLMHFFVVSGFHLNILESFCHKIKFSKGLFIVLTAYGSICGWHPPIFRTYIYWLTTALFKNQQFYWKPWHFSLVSGFICLALNPTLMFSKSLLISWSASLLLHAKPGNDKLNLFLITGLVPLVSHFSNYHPLTILCSFLFALYFQFFLFPISFFIWFAPGLVNPMWSSTLAALQQSARHTPIYFHTQQPEILFYWVYFAFIAFATYKLFIFKNRGPNCHY